MAFQPQMFFEDVTLIRERDGVESRGTSKGTFDNLKVYLPIDLEIEEGDRIEQALPNGKTRTYLVNHLVYRQSPFGRKDPRSLDHIEAQVEVVSSRPKAPAPIPAPATVEGLHPLISEASAAKFRDGHYQSAVFDAFKAVEARVQTMTGSDESGKSLMSKVFGETAPLLDPSREGLSERNARDEREGFKFLFMGSTVGIRNPRGHGAEMQESQQEAFEYLCVASMLMRRLDIAEGRPSNP